MGAARNLEAFFIGAPARTSALEPAVLASDSLAAGLAGGAAKAGAAIIEAMAAAANRTPDRRMADLSRVATVDISWDPKRRAPACREAIPRLDA